MRGDADFRFYSATSRGRLAVPYSPTPEGLQLSRWRPTLDGWPTGVFASRANGFWMALSIAGAFSRDDLTVYAIHSGNRLLHRVLVTPRWYRFPFMARDDLQLGDLWTAPDHRGRGLARLAARAIHADFAQTCDKFWYLVPADNVPSIRLVERMGYDFVGVGLRTRPLGMPFLGQFEMTGASPPERPKRPSSWRGN